MAWTEIQRTKLLGAKRLRRKYRLLAFARYKLSRLGRPKALPQPTEQASIPASSIQAISKPSFWQKVKMFLVKLYGKFRSQKAQI